MGKSQASPLAIVIAIVVLLVVLFVIYKLTLGKASTPATDGGPMAGQNATVSNMMRPGAGMPGGMPGGTAPSGGGG
jgi:hypothetical protein